MDRTFSMFLEDEALGIGILADLAGLELIAVWNGNEVAVSHLVTSHYAFMQSSYRIAPAPPEKSASTRDTANSLGLHDTLQNGPASLASHVKTHSSIKDRLENVGYFFVTVSSSLIIYQWDAAQDNLRLSLKRDIYGMHAPMRLLMERKLVSAVRGTFRSPVLSSDARDERTLICRSCLSQTCS